MSDKGPNQSALDEANQLMHELEVDDNNNMNYTNKSSGRNGNNRALLYGADGTFNIDSDDDDDDELPLTVDNFLS
jgi:hypothetical protein